ncbi:KR-domain-containing protein [Basidiobolus meristosporus CBS 931.73]|uniref:KR-domain-containing protein n=1 Tax=Basidiobolus meristosporus CBS 931.73 TaxID=1314790 RepID=A0A1Y1XMB4_9FUNG|nr:KR-domain-containing protein [Basidiobolus meristosporus CBS 931.73]|eukprot:ORX86872.1 KR-domain-containing protein [Basidiobolus meristosporus CBS 931.73]
MAFDVAASLPIVYCTAYYGLIDIARLQPGETVLIHAAAGGVGQAAIMLAKWVGAEIFVTAGSSRKVEFLKKTYGIQEDHIFSSRDNSFVKGVLDKTHGRGVDVILNSLAGELLRETWDCVANFGRFIEMGKRDIQENGKLDMGPFIRNVMFASVDLTVIFRQNKPLGARLFQEVMALLKTGSIREVSPITIYDFSNIESAFRFMQAGKHIGKIVLTPKKEDMVKVRVPPRKKCSFREDRTYLLVGCLGGLGRSLSMWMRKNGAKYFLFLNRSGVEKSEAKSLVQDLMDDGAIVNVVKGDVSVYQDVQNAIDAAKKSMPAIGGVIQAAMVLKDAIFMDMPHKVYRDVIQPKVTGSWNLHNLLMDSPLEFFVMFASLSGVIGNRAQSNYAAANTYLDALARHRRNLGLPGSTIDVGMIVGVGYVAENAQHESTLRKYGYLGIDEREFHEMLDAAISGQPLCDSSDMSMVDSETSAQYVTGVGNPRSMKKHMTNGNEGEGDAFWAGNARFSHLIVIADDDSKKGQESEIGTEVRAIKDLLKECRDKSEVALVVVEAFLKKLSVILALPIENLDPAQSTSKYGLDSLIAVEIRNWFYREFTVDVPLFGKLPVYTIFCFVTKVNFLSFET